MLILGVHQNPMSLDRNSDPEARHKPLALNETIQELRDDVVEYFTEICNHELCAPYVSIIKGKICSGKSTILLEVVDQLYKDIHF